MNLGRNKAWFAWTGLAIMLVIRLWDGTLQAGEGSSYSEIMGWALLIVGFSMAAGLDEHFQTLLHRLIQRKALDVTEDEIERLLKDIERRAKACEWIGSAVFVLSLVAGYCYYYAHLEKGDGLGLDFWLKLSLEIVGGVIVGAYAGRLVVYGSLGRWLRRNRVKVRVQPAHPDGAGGLRIVGDYYFYQAGLIMLPVIFFAFWFVAASTWNFEDWQIPFGLAFLGMLAIEILAFVMPLRFFHREMARHADGCLREADALGNEVIDLRNSLRGESDPKKAEAIRGRAEILEKRIADLESAPTWPLDTRIRRKFAWSNLAVILAPIIIKLTDLSEVFGTAIGKFLETS